MSNLNAVLPFFHLNPVIIVKIVLPIGVSFIVFEKITYTVDIYRKEGTPSESLIDYLLYVFLFPKLLAGPIIKYHDIALQLKTHTHDIDSVVIGVTRFCFGFAKKVFIADTMGEIADQVFNLSPGYLGFYNAWFGVICYTFQIYFDFSGYSDMAIGLARIFGFRLLENFNYPYISRNFTEFWRRWHISLSTWIKSYLYIPLGGNRVSRPRMYFNLWFCFLLCGIWHGANWTFVIWGAYHGLFLIIDKLGWEQFQKKLPSFVNVAITFLFTMVGWSLFRSENSFQMMSFLNSMFNPSAFDGKFIYVPYNVTFFFILGLLLCFIPAFKQYGIIMSKIDQRSGFRFNSLIVSIIIFTLSIFKMSAISYNPFLYFRF
jgi:alginate O-acetyltransferase complex protein AlgI